ncbi:hypothetical protein [Citrobacter portucalensis]|uniref:hypothetical protein n=1 Tax=Citrobacter portucalensis TaxID=1639133 RepID=UPI00321AE54B
MFENYVCKIYVSNDPHFSSHLEATAFGFDNGQQQKILTAAHVVTNALGIIYPVSNTLKEGANKRGNSSRLTQSFHFFMFEPIFSPVNALNQPI